MKFLTDEQVMDLALKAGKGEDLEGKLTNLVNLAYRKGRLDQECETNLPLARFQTYINNKLTRT